MTILFNIIIADLIIVVCIGIEFYILSRKLSRMMTNLIPNKTERKAFVRYYRKKNFCIIDYLECIVYFVPIVNIILFVGISIAGYDITEELYTDYKFEYEKYKGED